MKEAKKNSGIISARRNTKEKKRWDGREKGQRKIVILDYLVM